MTSISTFDLLKAQQVNTLALSESPFACIGDTITATRVRMWIKNKDLAIYCENQKTNLVLSFLVWNDNNNRARLAAAIL